MRSMRCLACFALCFFALLLPTSSLAAEAAEPRVVRVDIDGAVDPLVARYVTRAVDAANDSGADAILVRIDTPGGLDSSMRAIVQALLESRVPVVCWAGPSGARAASAGAVIMIGCPLAAMAPGTNIGAAHPVGISGDVLPTKVLNDAAAYMRGLAQANGRNADVAERMVRASLSVPANEAVSLDVVDLIAPGEAALMNSVEGRPVSVAGGDSRVEMRTAGARIEPAEMTFIESLLHNSVDPNIAFILFLLGLAGLIFEVLSPGFGVSGVFGGVALVASMLIIGMLPVNVAGLILLVAGIAFFVVEAYTPGFGAPAAAGFVSVIAGGFMLFDSSVPGAQVSRALVVGLALSLALFFAFTVRAIIKTRDLPPGAPTLQQLVGETGIVETALAPTGVVRVHHEPWTARALRSEQLSVGTRVVVSRVDGLTLEVEPLEGDLPDRNPSQEVEA